MNPHSEPLVSPPLTPHLLSRHFRHEIGNFLQAVYSSAAVLKRRLPADAGPLLDLTSDLRTQAEACRLLLDTVHDFLAPAGLHRESVNLREVAEGVVRRAVACCSHLRVTATGDPTPPIWADAQRLTQAASLLVGRACESAQQSVELRSAVDAARGTATWEVIDDGPGIADDDLEPLFGSLLLLRDRRLVQGLAPVCQIVELHGGTWHTDRLPAGQFRVRLVLPLVAAGGESPADRAAASTVR